MEVFDVKQYWIERYYNSGNSGWGSWNPDSIKFKADYVNNVIKKYGINTICELGCGDGNQLGYFSGYTQYHGYDITPVAISMCKILYEKDNTKIFYYNIEDVLNKNYDLSLSLDVIYHLVEEDMYHTYMRDLFSLSNTVCIFSTDDEVSKEIEPPPHLRNRKIGDYIKEKFPDFKLVDVKRFYEVSNNNVGFFLYKKS